MQGGIFPSLCALIVSAVHETEEMRGFAPWCMNHTGLNCLTSRGLCFCITVTHNLIENSSFSQTVIPM